MIPLDQHFNELLNETVPFVLPKASRTAPPKVVPTATVAKPAERKRPEPDVFSTLTTSTLDCYVDTASEITAMSQAAPVTAAVEKTSHTEAPRSRVEITAERSVPFEIDTRMIINRPRLSLKESGLPVSLNPTEPDPSIVGESVLGLKLPSPAKSASQTSLSQAPKIRGDISDEMIGLLEQQSVKSEKPALKAFNPEEKTCPLEKKAFNPEDLVADRHTTTPEGDKLSNSWLHENSCEVSDNVEECNNIEECNDVKECETAASTDQGLTEEEQRWAEEVAEIDACELADTCELTDACELTDEVAEDDLADETQTYETQTDEPAFFPMLQVDRFAWPDFCTDMHPIIKTQLTHLGDQLIAKSASGKNVIAVVGSGPGAGSTSIMLGLATALEAAGQRIAIIDANINAPTLANSLGLEPEQGWETVASGKLPVDESLIDSIEDHIALLPLCLNESEKLTFGVRPSENERMNDAIGLMREYYDLVLIDLGSPGASDIAAFSNMSEWIDSAVVVHNLRDGSRAQLIQTKNLMRDYGVPIASIAENFAPRETCFDDQHDHRAA